MSIKIRSKSVDNNSERLLCIGCIISDRVVGHLAPLLVDRALFTAEYTRIVVDWCLDYYKQFGKAPRFHIKDIFESKKDVYLDDEVADLIERLLVSLNDQALELDGTQCNDDYFIAEAEKYIRSRKATILNEDISALLSKGQIDEVESRILEYKSVEPQASRPLQIDLEQFSAIRYLTEEPRPIRWLLKDSLPRNCLAVIAGPPAAGKGTLSIQLAVALAAKERAFQTWESVRVSRVLYISAEDDQTVLDIRFYAALHALDEDLRETTAQRIRAVSVQGNVSLCAGDRYKGLTATPNLDDLRALVAAFKPDVVFLDTLARFLATEENDNNAMTVACSFLEEIIKEHGCTVILNHHIAKATGDNCDTESTMHAALAQGAVRGASALVGCARWVLLMAPLGQKLAKAKIGPAASDKPSGSYVAVRVAKKNVGPPEPIHFLARGEGGMLARVEELRNDDALEDATKLAEIIRQRENGGLDALTKSRGYEALPGWASTQFKKALAKGFELGLFDERKKPNGKGYVLCSGMDKKA